MSLIPNEFAEALTPDENDLLSSFLTEWEHKDRTLIESLTPHELDALIPLLEHLKYLNPKIDLNDLYELDYIEKPVSPEEFLQHEYYYGKEYHTIYPCWRKEIPFVADPKNEIKEFIISGAIGTGKSNTACLLMALKLYYLTCLRDPHSFFPNINKGSQICIGLFNTTLSKTDQSLYFDFKKVLNNIPYFKDKFKARKTHKSGLEIEEIILPRHIVVIPGSNESHALSLNLFSAVLDEQNFREGKKIPKYEESNAFQLYRNARTRVDSRFRGAPTLLVTISSANTMSDFMVEHIEKRQNDPHVHVARYSQWEAKPGDFKSGKFFKIALGDEKSASVILKDTDALPEGRKIIEVPEELRLEFEVNIDGNLRDLAGVDTIGQGALIHDKLKINEAAEKGSRLGLSHPFSMVDLVLDIRTQDQIEDIFEASKLLMESGSGYRLIRHPYAIRYMHVDLAESGDSAAISMAHIVESRSENKIDLITKNPITVFLPVIEIDFMLRIRPPIASTIDFDKIIRFIDYLRNELQINIGRITYDGYQSHHSIQILKKNGYEAKNISLDLKDNYYLMLQQTIATGRLISYPYEPFESEIKYLVHNAKIKKVDHIKGKCFVGETRIPLLDGTFPMLSELVGKEVWVYSIDKNRKIVPGKARGRRTKQTTDLVDVILSNGAVARCTPDHPWMLRDGSYKKAIELQLNVDKLMCIYYELSVVSIIPVKLEDPVWVYDLEVDLWDNFAISNGAVVHNSKDVSDSVCGAVAGCYEEGEKSKASTLMPPDIVKKDNKVINWATNDYKVPNDKQVLQILKRK